MGLDALAIAAIVVLLLGFPDRARQLMNEALRRAKHIDSQYILGLVHIRGAMLCGLLGDGRAVLEHAQELRHLSANQPAWAGIADMDTGKALMIQSEWEEGVRYLRKGVAFHKALGLASQPIWAELYEAEFFTNQGQVDDGLALIGKALTDSEELLQIRSPALRQRADLLALSNADTSAVDAAYRAAIECARSQGAKYYELQATTRFARWLKSQRRFEEARTILAAIYNWFAEGFDTVALKEAKALLDELSNKPSAPRRSSRPRKGR
jgi:ATP/maltotriose-dependent transcriptional regulator MalT